MIDILVPDPLLNDRQYERLYHFDIPSLGDVELTDELNYLRPLLWGLPPDHWLRERVRMLDAERIKRRGATRYEFSKQPKPKPAEGVML